MTLKSGTWTSFILPYVLKEKTVSFSLRLSLCHLSCFVYYICVAAPVLRTVSHTTCLRAYLLQLLKGLADKGIITACSFS